MVWNLFHFKSDFSFGKSQKSQGTKYGLQWVWVTWVIWCFAKKLGTRGDASTDPLWWRSCQSPVARSCGLLNQPNSFHREMFSSSLTQNLMQICCSTRSVILNATTTQYTCSLTRVYGPHWLVQWSHCSRMCIPSTLLGSQVILISCKLFLLH